MGFNQCVFFVAVLVLTGCSSETVTPPKPASGKPANAQKPDGESLKQAVAEIVKLRDQIRDGFADGDVDAAHGPLHEVGTKLEELSKLTAESELSDADQETVKDCVDKLFTAFGEVDKTLHGQEGSTYEEEAATIDKAMETLVKTSNGKDATSGQ